MKSVEYTSLESFFKSHEIKDKEKYMITRAKKSFSGYKHRYRSHNKNLWLNNLAEYYFRKGYSVSGHGSTIIKKILSVTSLTYDQVVNRLDSKYKQKLERLELAKKEIINDYERIKNLDMVAKKYGTSGPNMSAFLRSNGVTIELRPRHQFKLTKTIIPKKLSFLGKGVLYILSASYCDYLYKHPFNMNCTLIEEKQTLSQYNYGTAITQLMIGEQIIQEQTDYIVVNKVIFCHKISEDATSRGRLKYLIPDVKKYLEIDIKILTPSLPRTQMTKVSSVLLGTF